MSVHAFHINDNIINLQGQTDCVGNVLTAFIDALLDEHLTAHPGFYGGMAWG